jgi:two-component system sensor histidine kinase ChvG
VTLYSALPVTGADGSVNGVVLVSQSSYRILQDLYRLRLDIFTIFLLSLLATVIISIFLSVTISRPLKKLSRKAEQIFTPGSGLSGTFVMKKKHDEIGKLAASLDRLREQLKDHIEFIESFAGDVSHELKNPLASIRSSAEIAGDLARENEVDRDGLNRFLGIIQRETSRMEGLISRVREISQIDARIGKEKTGRIELCGLIRQTAERFQLQSRKTETGIDVGCIDEPVYIRASAERIIQLADNLIDNALSFSPPGGRVTVEVSTKENGTGEAAAVLTVSDSGPGVPRELIGKIFNRFFSYRTNKEGGGARHAGLGLSIVKSVAEGYGGTVSAENKQGGGAEFTVLLPVEGPG